MKTLITGAFKYSKEQIEKLNSIGCETVFIQDGLRNRTNVLTIFCG